MANHPYFAVAYAYCDDGTEMARMPCRDENEVVARASRYDRVRVVPNEGPCFWLRVKKLERLRQLSLVGENSRATGWDDRRLPAPISVLDPHVLDRAGVSGVYTGWPKKGPDFRWDLL